MIYLAELLVVMTNGLKIVRIRARNMHRVHGHKRLDDDASLISEKRQCRVVDELGRRPVEWDNRCMSRSDL